MKGVTATLTIINEKIRDRLNEKTGSIEMVGKCNRCGKKFFITYDAKEEICSFPCDKENCPGKVIAKMENDIPFTCLLSFISNREDVYLPPFLPAFNFRISKNMYNEIKKRVQELQCIIRENYGKDNYKILKEEIDSLKEMGWNDIQIVEAVAVTGYFNYINTLSNVFGLGE